jgi:hypothetical protein
VYLRTGAGDSAILWASSHATKGNLFLNSTGIWFNPDGNLVMANDKILGMYMVGAGNPAVLYVSTIDQLVTRIGTAGWQIVNNAHTLELASISDAGAVGLATSKLQIGADGNLQAIKNVAGYIWPAAHAAGALTNNGSGGLSWVVGLGFSDVEGDPAPLGTAADGTSAYAARRDHVHAMPKLDDLTAPDDNTDLNVSTSLHGLCPKAPNDATWDEPPYTLQIVAENLATITDASIYYAGCLAGLAPGTTAALAKLYIPRAGTITKAYILWNAGTAGSAENISAYIRLNNTSDTLIATVGTSGASKEFSNTSLSIAVAAGDYIELKIACPTWATNPANVRIGGVVYIS